MALPEIPIAARNVCTYTVVTSDATGLNVSGGKPAVLYGLQLVSAGTMAAVYNSKTAAGDVMIPSTTASVNFGGAGVLCENGITCDWTSGTWNVLWAPLRRDSF